MSDNLVTTDLQVKGRASFLILLQTVNDLVLRQTDAQPSFNIVRDDIIRFAKNFPDGGDEILLVHRRMLIKVLREVFTLNLYVDVARDWLIHGGLLYESALVKESVPGDGKSLFFMLLQSMIDQSQQENEIAAHVLQLSVSHIPLRMATLKYKSYIADSVKKSNIPLGSGSVESFRRFFNPVEFLKDREWLEELRKPLDAIWEKDCAAMNPDGLLSDFKTVNAVRKDISKLVDYLCVLFDGVNAAHISMRYCPADFNKEEARGLNESQLDEAVENELRKITFGPDSEIPESSGECKKVTEMFYETGLDHFSVMDNDDPVFENDTESFLTAFLPYLEAPELIANRKRFLRQHLMAYLPYPYDIEDFQKYFLDTYAALDEANRRYLCVYVANQVKKSQEKSGK